VQVINLTERCSRQRSVIIAMHARIPLVGCALVDVLLTSNNPAVCEFKFPVGCPV
jgi:hypothetical protein